MINGFAHLVGRPLFLIAVVTSLSACNAISGLSPANFETQPIAHSALSSAPLPSYNVGDKFYYSNGAREAVVSVNGDDVELLNNRKRKSIYSKNLFQPYKYLESSSRHTTKTTDAEYNRLWPLSVGHTDKYITDASYVTTQTGQKDNYRQIWNCEVEDTARVNVVSGTFDTYRVTCERYNESGKRYQTRTWYYAPELQTYVLRRDFYFSSKKVRFRELTAIRPDLSGLERKNRNSIVRIWQNVLENKPSGELHTWTSKDGSVKAEVKALSTFKGENGQYCRTYRQYITLNGNKQTYGGVACRTSKLKWRTPRRV